MSHPTTVTGPADIARNTVESIATRWDDVRDSAFFRCTAEIFPPAFTLGASLLLASYDHLEPPHRLTPRPR